MALPLGPLITGGAAIFSSLFGGDSQSNTRTKEKTKTKSQSVSASRTRSNLGQMVRQAEKYGFNPLTVLRAGGLGAYSSSMSETQARSKSNSKGKNITSSSSGAPLAAGIAAAGQAVGNALTNTQTPEANTASNAFNAPAGEFAVNPQAEHDLVMRQLAGSNWDQGGASLGGVPTLPSSNEVGGGAELRYTKPTRERTKDDDVDVPGGLLGNQSGTKFEPSEWRPWFPKRWVSDYKLEIPTEELFNVESGEGIVGDNEIFSTAQGAFNSLKILQHNQNKIPAILWGETSGIRDNLEIGYKTLNAVNQEYLKGVGVNPWDPAGMTPGGEMDSTFITQDNPQKKIYYTSPGLGLGGGGY